jgi:4-hydroxythreonine-4-phosphate dehydrogenase
VSRPGSDSRSPSRRGAGALTSTSPPFYLLADAPFIARSAKRIAPDVSIAVVEPAAAASAFKTALPVVDIGVPVSAEPGRPDRSSAPAAIAAIRPAVADVNTGQASAIVTNPVLSFAVNQ